MTAKTPGTLNRDGTGRGKNVHTRPPQKKRGINADAMPQTISNLRGAALNTSSAAGSAAADPNKPLTEKQRNFGKFWGQGETISSASIRAGYATSAIGYNLARRPQIVAIYEAEKAAYEASAGMTRKRVMDGLLEAVDMAKLMAEPASMVSGWREIGRMCGYYEPIRKTLDITVNGNVTMERMNRLSDAELLKLIEEKISEEVTDDEDEDENEG